MISYDEVVQDLKRARSPTERRLYFAALLSKAGEASADEFIVVGGSAIEFYTSGRYTSGDIDIVSTMPKKWAGILREWRFKEQGRIWYSDDLGIVVDLVKPPYTYDVTRTQVLVTRFGTVRVAAVEDLLIKRLESAKFWKLPGDMDQAKLLAIVHWDRIDWEYVRDLAKKREVADALSNLMDAISRAK